MKIVETKKVNGIRIQKAYKEVVESEPTGSKKAKARYEIENNVFDLRDSVADNAKMISLLTSLVSRIWSIIPDDQKDNLSDEEKQVIDYVIDKFDNTETWADVQFKKEGLTFADKLLERQSQVGSIIKGIYG